MEERKNYTPYIGSYDVITKHNRGVALRGAGRYQEAIDCFQKAIRSDPECAETYVQLALAYGDIGHKQEAIDTLKEGIKTISDKVDLIHLHYVLGLVYGCYGQWQEEIQTLKHCDKLNSELESSEFKSVLQAEINHCLGIAYSELGDSLAQQRKLQNASQ